MFDAPAPRPTLDHGHGSNSARRHPPVGSRHLTEDDTVFTHPVLESRMNWKPSAAPSQLNSCDCGSESVEEKPDGLVTLYRCADCGTSLGDITIGHEP